MKHSAFLEATVWLVLCLGSQVGLAQELIPVSQLGDRGVIFQTRPIDSPSAMESAQGVGDVNGDGIDDLLVSVCDQPLLTGPCEIVLIYGRRDLTGRHVLDESLPGTVRFRARATLRYPSTEGASAPAGDLNGDGFADFLFAYPYYPVDGQPRGSAYLVYGSSDLKGAIDVEDLGVTVPGVTFYSSDPTSRGVGRALLSIGDLNGDGRPDLAIASPFSEPGSVAPGGRIHVLFDTRNLPPVVDLADVGSLSPGMEVRGHRRFRRIENFGDVYAYFGLELAAAGDFDGDGYDDFLVEESNFYPNSHYLIHGSSRPPPLLDLQDLIVGEGMPGVTVFQGPRSDDIDLYLGPAVGIGDLNLDGFSDLAVGLPRLFFGLAPHNGRVYLFHGAADFPRWIDLNAVPPARMAATFHAIGFPDAFGGALAYPGDLNGDGAGDLLVGAPRSNAESGRHTGEAYAVFLKRDGSGETFLEEGFPGIRLPGDTPEEWFGAQVASAGDFNGDGVPDFVARTRGHAREVSTGRAYVIYGVGSGPEPLRLRRVDPDFGPKRGATVVTLRGSGFAGAPRVSFGGAAAPNVTVVSASELRVLTPSAATPGFVEVRVGVGAEEVALTQGYEYVPDFPRLDLANLGEGGLVLEGDPVESERLLARSGGKQAAFVDLDHDGADELLVQARVGGSWRILVVRGGPQPPARIHAFSESPHLAVVSGPTGSSTAGVAAVGDVNGDGIDDAGIGEPGGTGFLLFGRTPLATEISIEEEVAAGRAVRLERGAPDPQDAGSILTLAPLGDLTGDGIDDFATGFSRGPAGVLEGEVLLVGGRKSWTSAIDLDTDSGFNPARITGPIRAMDLEAVGDVNGDRFPDLLVDGPIIQKVGFAYLIYGRRELAGALDLEAMVAGGGAVRIEIPKAAFVLSLAGPGDVTGDGFADLLLGNEGGGALVNQGAVYLIPGGPDLLPVVTLLEAPVPPDGVVRVFGEGAQNQAGRVGAAGDFNADGFADFLVASPGFEDLDPGNVFLVLGGRSLPEQIELRRIGGQGIEIRGQNRPGGAGSFAGPSGDLNGDGQPDFVFGESPSFPFGDPSPEESIARVYLIFGPYGGKIFVRGDANSDGTVDVSDAVTILSHLFLGAAGPLCEDALDCDDQGTLEITDAIVLLQFLFLGGPALPAPQGPGGKDPTDDRLGCLGF